MTAAYQLSTVIIPAFNEGQHIGKVVQSVLHYANEVIVIDDGSSDNTPIAASEAGALVIQQEHNGYIAAIKRGFCEARNDIIVTVDADGEHYASDIPRMIAPITAGDADMVLGKREHMARISENLINWLTNIKVQIGDSCTGFRAIKKELALKLKLKGLCTCGILVLEADYLGARISEVPIEIIPISKARRIAWSHFTQVFYILGWLLKTKRRL